MGSHAERDSLFIKDVIGPKGCVSIAASSIEGQSDNIDSHTKAEALRLHHAALDASGHFLHKDEIIDLSGEPGHDELCEFEQRYLLRSIQENLDLSAHIADAVNSLRIVLAAEESVRTGKTIDMSPM